RLRSPSFGQKTLLRLVKPTRWPSISTVAASAFFGKRLKLCCVPAGAAETIAARAIQPPRERPVLQRDALRPAQLQSRIRVTLWRPCDSYPARLDLARRQSAA